MGMLQGRFGKSVIGLLAGIAVASCGGGGGSSDTKPPPTLVSIALSPLTVSLAPGATQQLTVTGTYSDGSTQVLASSGETFSSSSSAVATVSAAGVVTVVTGAAAGSTATVTATDNASHVVSATADSTVVTVAGSPTLVSIALSPLTVSLAPGATQQLTVTGTYSDGSTQALSASAETFTSSSSAVATVSAAGVVTVATGAAVGSTATITATDNTSHLVTSASNSTVVTVAASSVGPPTATSIAAATATANDNSVCTTIAAVSPFYWEIGNASAALASGSVGTPAVLASTRVSIASASKWVYGTYVVQKRGGVANLTTQDIPFLNFTSGYTNMGSDTQGATCTAPPSGADSINYCLTLSSASGAPFNGINQSTVGVFDYDAGHEENHAGKFQPEINALDANSELGPAIASGLGLPNSVNLLYTQPLLAGGIFASANDYTPMLRGILSGQLLMHDALGTNAVCAWSVGSGCNAASSPVLTEKWHYSITHWVEDDPTQNNDGAFSSPGAFGFYPWIEANKTYYGVISRFYATGQGIQNGVASAQCGALIRHAWDTGTEQMGTIPNP